MSSKQIKSKRLNFSKNKIIINKKIFTGANVGFFLSEEICHSEPVSESVNKENSILQILLLRGLTNHKFGMTQFIKTQIKHLTKI